MKRKLISLCAIVLLAALLSTATPQQVAGNHSSPDSPREQRIAQAAETLRPQLISQRRDFHMHPELSNREERTARVVAERLRALGADDVKTGVGRYGVVALVRGGRPGPVVAVRADMDALPIQEVRDVPYRSQNAGVMHACGHDVHVTTLLGTAKMLAQLKSKWHGTVMLVGQPAEEVVKGAEGMLRDDLYSRFGTPNFAIAVHDHAGLPAGVIGYFPGYFMAGADSVNVTIRGLGGHGAAPQSTKDPIVMAAQFINACRPSSAARTRRSTPPSSPSARSTAARSATSSPTRCSC